MAFYELMIKEGMEPFNYDKIVEAITDLHPRLKQSANYTKTEDRIKNINICKGLIRDYFKKTDNVYRSAGSWPNIWMRNDTFFRKCLYEHLRK